MLSAGPVCYGEGDCISAQSDNGEAFTVLPASSQRELQSAVERRPGGRLLHREAQRWAEDDESDWQGAEDWLESD